VLIENFRPGAMEGWNLGPMNFWPPTEADRCCASALWPDGALSQPGRLRVVARGDGWPAPPHRRARPRASARGVSIGDTLAACTRHRYPARAAAPPCQRPRAGDRTSRSTRPSSTAWRAFCPSTAPSAPCAGRGPARCPASRRPCLRATDRGYALIAGNGDSIFRRLMTLIGRDDLAADPALATTPAVWRAWPNSTT